MLNLIICNLKRYLEEHKISINKLSEETGVSRKTLTALANNTASSVQFSILETLLDYFQVSLEDFITRSKKVLTVVDSSYYLEDPDFFRYDENNVLIKTIAVNLNLNDGINNYISSISIKCSSNTKVDPKKISYIEIIDEDSELLAELQNQEIIQTVDDIERINMSDLIYSISSDDILSLCNLLLTFISQEFSNDEFYFQNLTSSFTLILFDLLIIPSSVEKQENQKYTFSYSQLLRTPKWSESVKSDHEYKLLID